jgi:hypothetical protein
MKIKFRNFSLIFIVITGFDKSLWADSSVSSDTSIGATLFSTGLDYNSGVENGSGKKKEKWNWGVGYTFTNSQVINTDTNASSTDQTSDFSADLNFENVSHLQFGSSLEFSTTPNEKLTDFAPSASFGYILRPEESETSYGIKATI